MPDSAWYHAVKPRDLNAAGDVAGADLAILPADLNYNLTAGDDADVAAWLGAHGLP